MPEYTLTPIPDTVLYVDGVPAIVPALVIILKMPQVGVML